MTTNSEAVKNCCCTFLRRAVNFVSVCFFYLFTKNHDVFSLNTVFHTDIEEIRLRSQDFVRKMLMVRYTIIWKFTAWTLFNNNHNTHIYKKNKFTFFKNKNAFKYFGFFTIRGLIFLKKFIIKWIRIFILSLVLHYYLLYYENILFIVLISLLYTIVLLMISHLLLE